ncbi:mechanosensitive ion channel [archaeon]|nr:mechanosensitive ion channel [archaeon]
MGFEETTTIIAAALLILLGALVIGGIVGKIVKRLFAEFELNRILKKQGVKLPLEEFFSTIARYTIYFIGVVWALTYIGVSTLVVYIALIMVLVLIVLFIALAFKDILPNVVAGMVIYQKGIVKKGERIALDSLEGEVKEVTLTFTKIKARNGDVVVVPNYLLIKGKVIKKADKMQGRKAGG